MPEPKTQPHPSQARRLPLLLLLLLLLAAAHVAATAPTNWQRRSPATFKRGLAESSHFGAACADLALANQNASSALSFFYSWGTSPNCSAPPAVTAAVSKSNHSLGFVPMFWGRHSINQPLPRGASALLGFNEPNHRGQANMDPREAAALWPVVEAAAAANDISLVGSPAAAPCGGGNSSCNGGDAIEWLDAFLTACSGCRIDFIATHYYGCSASSLQSYLDAVFVAFRRPIWLTEFNCGGGSSVPSIAKQAAWMRVALPILDSTPFVHRYAWMSGRNGHLPEASLFHGSRDAPTLTPLGELYLSI